MNGLVVYVLKPFKEGSYFKRKSTYFEEKECSH